ncbi:hypothetical protein T492DRAFT_431134 [Pavlovales sp. CCMP2436]|nr:hypothetical protein T492DRAFT_431134 [Pavlovales sp. CCMP2436]
MTAAFHVRVFEELFEEDALLVMAKGMGVQTIVAAFVRLHCQTDSLVLLLNATPEAQRMLVEQMLASSVALVPTIVTNHFSPVERCELYARGGVLCITPRLLVVDMLSGRVPIERVKGMLIDKAHEVSESSNLAFIVRLYRQRNGKGFLKAFTEDAQSLTRGMSKSEKTLKLLRLRKLSLWPRFQADVRAELEDADTAPQVIEYKLPLSDRAQAVQDALVECVDGCLTELGRMHKSLDLAAALGVKPTKQSDASGRSGADSRKNYTNKEHLSKDGAGGSGRTQEAGGSGELLEHALFKSFDSIVRMQLDSVWHQCGRKTKQLVSDLATLRKLLRHLCTFDAITYYELLLALSALELPRAVCVLGVGERGHYLKDIFIIHHYLSPAHLFQ